MERYEGEDLQVEFTVDGQPVVNEQPRRPKIYMKRTTLSWIMMGVCILMYIVELIMGGSENTRVLLDLGAKFSPYIAVYNQYWRLIAPMFLHIGVWHLLCNMYALYNFGPITERIFGPVKFTALYFISGVMGCLFSYGFGEVGSLSAGASGAIFGIIGSTLYFRKEHKDVFSRIFGINVFFIIIVNIVLGFAGSGVDNLGHIGGLVGGYAAANVLGLYRTKPRTLHAVLFGIALATLTAVCLVVGYWRTIIEIFG